MSFFRRGLTVGCLLAVGARAWAWDTNNWQFLENIERANLRFFQEQKRGPYRLLIDTADYDATYPNPWPPYSSVAGIGFELSAICLGHYRGWISFSNAYEQVLQSLRFFTGQLSDNSRVGERINGWTFHTYWLNDDGTNVAGTRFYMSDGLSLLDHSLLIAGCIFASEYFKGTEAGELGAKLYRETTWSWRPNSDYNFGYSENLLAIVESAAAPQYAKGIEAHNIWRDYCTPPWPRTLQLYFWQYPHAYVDFRNRWDFRGENHAIVAMQSILYQRQCAIDLHQTDPVKYDMLGSNCWGWTAATPSDWYRQMAPWPLWLGEYYDTEHASDSGSITPIGLPGCMIYAGTETLAAMKYLYEEFYVKGWNPGAGERPVWSDRYGFLNCLNKGKPWRYYTDPSVTNWYHPVNAGIDYGPNVLLLENYKIGSTWRWFMQNPSISSGMYTIGFGPPQNVSRATFSNSVNEFGGSFGEWHNDATPVVVAYENADFTNAYVGDKVVSIIADNSNEGAWIDLNNCDQRAQAQLLFWIKCSHPAIRLDIGLKDQFGSENKVRLTDFTGGSAPTNWTEVVVPIERFCLTGNVIGDTWPGSLAAVTYAFPSAGGGTVTVDYVAFTPDTVAPARPTNDFGVAMAGNRARIRWNPAGAERDVVGYHIWRRPDATSGFTRVTSTLVPAYRGLYEDTNLIFAIGQEARYAIQAFDNAEPQHSSPFAFEKPIFGGRLDVDWNNGVNPNVLGGAQDGYWGGAGPESFTFVLTNGPHGESMWVRRSEVASTWSGHFIDLESGDAGDYQALGFFIRGAAGGEQILIGLKDTDGREVKFDLAALLPSGVTTDWAPVIVPLPEFTNVNPTALDNFSITHVTPGVVFIADLGFLQGQRASSANAYFTEAENWTRQSGSPQRDMKAGASGGEVLGWGWGMDGGDYADYELYVARDLTNPTMYLQFACNQGDGRLLDVRWDDQFIGTVNCANTGGWGELSNHFSRIPRLLPSVTTGYHKLTFYANGMDEPVNLDCWWLADGASAFRECENHDRQSGSGGPDSKSGASGGQVLGSSWGLPAGSEAIYSNVTAGAQTGAWFHLWYARAAATGAIVDVELDGARRARLYCPTTAGWGERASHFDRASARIGPMDSQPHTLRLSVPEGGHPVNLDCFYLGPQAPEGHGPDFDGDGLSNREEPAAGTSPTLADTDGDGLADGRETQFGLAEQVSDPARRDTDGDGQDDGEESTAGTDPWDAASRFEFSAISQPAAHSLRLQWPAVSGRQYRLFFTGSLSNNARFEPGSGGIIIENNLAHYDDPATNRVRAYRVDVQR